WFRRATLGALARAGTCRPAARCGVGAAARRRVEPLRGLMEKAGGLFLLGFASIAFPCVLPLVPGYLSAVSAVEAQRLGDPGVGRRVAVASLPFVAGFAIVFVALGAAANLIAGVLNDQARQALAGFILVAVFFVRGMTLFRWMRDHYRVFSIVGGTILVVLGLLLFFDEFYRVQIYTHRVLEAIGLGDL